MTPKPERCSALEVTPSLANSPCETSTWQRPQMPRPPHTESMSTPRLRAAWSKGVPMTKRPRRPEGMNTTSASGLPVLAAGRSARASGRGAGSGTPAPAFPPAAGAFLALGQRLAELLDPAHAVLVMAHGHVRAHDRRHLLGVERIGDGRGHAGADQHGEERSIEAMPVGKPEAEIGGAAGGVDLQLLTQAPDQMEHAAPGLVQRTHRHDQGVDHDVRMGNAEIGGAMNDFLGHLEANVRVLGNAGLVVGNG